MAYTTEAAMALRLGSADRLAVLLADEAGAETAGRLDAAIAEAQGEIDGRLAPWYAVPLATVPSQVATWAADLALEILALSRPGGASGLIEKRAARARDDLAAVAARTLEIVGASRLDSVGGVTEPAKTFTRKEDQTDDSAGTMDTW